MDVEQLTEQLRQAMQVIDELRDQNASFVQTNEQLRDDNAALRRDLITAQQNQETLRHDFESLLASTQTLIESRDELQERVTELESVNKGLVDMLWGRRSERRTDSPDQMPLDFGDSEETPSEEEQDVITAQQQADEALDQRILRDAQARRRQRREQQRTREFPENITRRERVLDLSDEEKEGLEHIGDSIFERMRFEKPTVYIERIVRPKYVKPNEPEYGVVTRPAPLGIVEGCRYDFSVIAAIASQKFAFHNPTYRQQDGFAQSGWFPSRSTINHLINLATDTVAPLFEQMWAMVIRQPILMTDDTRLLLLTRNGLSAEQEETLRNRRQTGQPPDDNQPSELNDRGSVTSYAWLYRGLDGCAPYHVVQWSLGHQNAVVDEHLANFKGIIVADAFGGYAHIEDRSEGRILHASCNAHARRKFTKAEAEQPVLCAQALSFYSQLYDVEERGKLVDASGLLALRQREAVLIWERFGRWRESAAVQRALPKSRFGEAMGYLTNQWTALQRYLSDARIPIDNNDTEQGIRPLTVGRKNWGFLGHPHAAAGRLQLLSVVSSAQRHHLMVHDYLADVLAKLADAAQNHPRDLDVDSAYLLDLLPDRWAAAHPEAVRHGRVAENQVVSELKRARRARQRILKRKRAQGTA